MTETWLRFDSEDDEEPSHEATLSEFTITEGDDEFPDENIYEVEWWHTDVGQVSERRFDTREAAADFLTRNGYQDYTA